MPILHHPDPGTILVCDFTGFKAPEMVKRRPVIVISPKITARPNLCTIVAVSSVVPQKVMPFHMELTLPPPFDQGPNWLKGDMVYSMAFHRLDLVRMGKGIGGKRAYMLQALSAADFKAVRCCVLHGLGLSTLTKHVP